MALSITCGTRVVTTTASAEGSGTSAGGRLRAAHPLTAAAAAPASRSAAIRAGRLRCPLMLSLSSVAGGRPQEMRMVALRWDSMLVSCSATTPRHWLVQPMIIPRATALLVPDLM
jgi:hypothetical protein